MTSAAASLLFLAPGDVRKARVEPISWMRTCDAFARRGLDVSLAALAVERPDGVRREDVWRHFGLARSFRLMEVPTPLKHDSPVRATRLWGTLAGAVLALRTLVLQVLHRRPTVVYARSAFLLAPFVILRSLTPARIRPRLVFETHTLPNAGAARVARRADLVVVTSRKLEEDIVARLGVDPRRVLYAPLGPYNPIRSCSIAEARERLGLPPTATIACYSGKMVEDQTDFLLEAARETRRRIPGFTLVLVGGNPRIDRWIRERIATLGLGDAVLPAGFVEPRRVSLYQAAADVLVFHMSEAQAHYDYCTPAKGFEYQAVGRPVVAVDIPLFEEVFGRDGERAIRVRERSPRALADGIQTALELPDGGAELARRAQAAVEDRTWDARVDAVLRALCPGA